MATKALPSNLASRRLRSISGRSANHWHGITNHWRAIPRLGCGCSGNATSVPNGSGKNNRNGNLMKRLLFALSTLALLGTGVPATAQSVALTDTGIAASIVRESRNKYYATGKPCACPHDKARNGTACGGRSAYSRKVGAEPLCYRSDVTPEMIERYRHQKQASR